MKSPIFLFLFFCFLAQMGFSQEKSDEIPLTGQQKADLERASTLSKQVANLYSQGKYKLHPILSTVS